MEESAAVSDTLRCAPQSVGPSLTATDSVASYDVEVLAGEQAAAVCRAEQSGTQPSMPPPAGATRCPLCALCRARSRANLELAAPGALPPLQRYRSVGARTPLGKCQKQRAAPVQLLLHNCALQAIPGPPVKRWTNATSMQGGDPGAWFRAASCTRVRAMLPVR